MKRIKKKRGRRKRGSRGAKRGEKKVCLRFIYIIVVYILELKDWLIGGYPIYIHFHNFSISFSISIFIFIFISLSFSSFFYVFGPYVSSIG